jgi:hypothetical protein
MSKTIIRPIVTFTGAITLNESEMRALHAMASYGADNFLRAFYEKLGRTYVEPYEHGVRGLFQEINEQVGQQISAIDNARRLLRGQQP